MGGRINVKRDDAPGSPCAQRLSWLVAADETRWPASRELACTGPSASCSSGLELPGVASQGATPRRRIAERQSSCLVRSRRASKGNSMRQCFSIAILFAAALVDGAAAVGDDTFLFGHDRMAFPRSSSRGRWANWDAQDEDTALRKKMGDDSPLRGGVSVGHPRRHSVGYDLLSILREEIDGDAPARRSVADGRCAVELDWENVGRFLRPIETRTNVGGVLRLVRGDDSFDALTPAQLSWVFKEIDRSGAACPLKIARRDIDMESLAKGCFQDNGLWMGHFVLRHGLSLWEYKYAIDRRRRVAAIHRELARMPERRCTRDLENSLDCLSPPVPVPLFLDSPYQPSDLPAELLHANGPTPAGESSCEPPYTCPTRKGCFKNMMRWSERRRQASWQPFLATRNPRPPGCGRCSRAPTRTCAGLRWKPCRKSARRHRISSPRWPPPWAARIGRGARRSAGHLGASASRRFPRCATPCGTRAPRVSLTALGEIGPAAKGAGARIAGPCALRGSRRAVVRHRRARRDRPGSGGGRPRPAASVLADEHSALQGTAVRSLGLIGPGAKDAVPDLVASLFGRYAQRPPRACTALAIGRIGPAAKDAVPAVRSAYHTS